MLEVTDLAVQNLKAYLEQNKVSSAVRVALMSGCSGSALGLALDEEKKSDSSFDEIGLQFLVDKELLQQCGSIKVDFIEAGSRSGFSINSENPISKGEGKCGSCNGSCG